MKIEKIKVSEIIPYADNAKLHPERQIEQIKSSILEFGFNDPIAIDENNVVIEGNGRLMAIKDLGFKEVDCIRIEGLTEDQKRAYILVHNQLTMNTGFDIDILNKELERIKGIDMTQFDFEIDIDFDLDIDLGGTVEDNVPELDENAEPKAKLGDIYQLGRHRLMCGDSTKAEDIDRLMDGAKADMVFTDPPYGYNYQSNMRTKTEKFDVLENDDKILDFFPNLLGRVKGFVMICTTWKVLDKWLPLFKKYFDLSNMIIWDKGGGGIGDLKHTFSTDYEVILCANNGEEIREKRIGSVWSIGKDNANDYEHPTQKPVALSANAIRHTTDKGQTVLDCFGGSGSTLIACEQLNRKCYMCELDPRYVDVIIDRWEKFTGQKAELIEG
jgi:DNA modification methylase